MKWLLLAVKRFRRNQLGAMAVEFALVGPVFLITAYALFQVGFGIYAQATLAQIAEKGARQLLFASDDRPAARQAILDEMAGTALDPGQLTIRMNDQTAPYAHVELSLDYLYQAPGPIPLPQDITLNSVVLVPIEQQ